MNEAIRPIRVAVVNDYALVVQGLRAMLQPFPNRVRVVDLQVRDTDVKVPVDIALYDTFGRDESVLTSARAVLADQQVRKAVLYSWAIAPAFAERAIGLGASGVISKTSTPEDLVNALEAVHAGRTVISPTPAATADRPRSSRRTGNWPGSEAGLTQREAEMIALITQGLTNADIAATAYLSPNSVKSYIRSAYKKIGVVRRSQAVGWGMQNGLGRPAS